MTTTKTLKDFLNCVDDTLIGIQDHTNNEIYTGDCEYFKKTKEYKEVLNYKIIRYTADGIVVFIHIEK